MENTEQITAAISEFLKSIDQTDLIAKEIIFETKKTEKSNLHRERCKWVWDPNLKKLVWKCF